jgi:2-alkyl-3-oxoalkanoate reductase
MTVLVTGASGFLGSRVVEQLCVSGTKRIHCFVRPNSDITALEFVRRQHSSTVIEYIVGNLLSVEDAIRATRHVDVVYHLASEMRGVPATLFSNSVVASRNLLDGIVYHSVSRVVLVSSIAVYGVAHLHPSTLVTEEAELDANPEKRDPYCFSKIHQELLFQRYRREHAFELVTLRAAVIYGELGNRLPSRLGFPIGPLFLQIAGGNQLPLTYVDNCASAVALAAHASALPEGAYNVVDDDLPTSHEYLRRYRTRVSNVSVLPVPLFLADTLSRALERYHTYSKAQIPLVLTPYRVQSTWKGHLYSNRKLKAIGWQQPVPTREAIARTLEFFKLNPNSFPNEPTLTAKMDRIQ